MKPFTFHIKTRLREASKKREEEEEEEKKEYVPTAEYIFKFHEGIPERFRSLPWRSLRSVSTSAADETAQSCKSVSVCSGVTLPYTPKLQTKDRARPTLVKSSAELEEEELARIRE